MFQDKIEIPNMFTSDKLFTNNYPFRFYFEGITSQADIASKIVTKFRETEKDEEAVADPGGAEGPAPPPPSLAQKEGKKGKDFFFLVLNKHTKKCFPPPPPPSQSH